ncbi:MAG: sulfite exporter TauE/SafE family protein [Halopseudomonas sp.]
MDWGILLLVTFFAATVQSTIGFGFGLIAVPAFLIMLNSVAAIQLVMIITLAMSCVHLPKLRGTASGQLLKWLSMGCALGFPLGILVYNELNLDAIKMAVAVLIILISLQNGWHLFSQRKSLSQGKGHSPAINGSLQQAPEHSRAAVMGVGVASGLMACSMAMPGPAVMLYLSRTALGKNEIRATMLTFFLFSYGGALLLQATLIGIESQTWMTAAVLTPSALMGVLVGHLLSKKINQQLFKGLVLLILLLTGLFMLINV